MVINFLKYSLRSFKKQQVYVIINVLGLSIGIACSLLISFYILNELSFDRFNTRQKRLFRVIQDSDNYGQGYTAAFTPAVLGPAIRKELPEVEGFLRMTARQNTVIEYNSVAFDEDQLVEADSSFFNFFSIPVLAGDPENLLNAPHCAVVSASAARKIFGNESPVGKLLKIGSDTIEYTVSGVMADIPEHSHFQADVLLSFMSNPRSDEQIWTTNSFSTYVLLKPNINYEKINDKISALISSHLEDEIRKESGQQGIEAGMVRARQKYHLQKLKDIHLDPSIIQEFKEAGDPKYLKIIGVLGALIILIAAINFMNLSTVQASGRTKEVGIKKLSGSSRNRLILQFMTESLILTIVSLIFALFLIKISLPFFNRLLGINVTVNLADNWYAIPFLIVFTLTVAFLSGSYPALYISSLNPSGVLKGGGNKFIQKNLLRKVLTVFQFSVSILLIAGTIIMYRQITFMLNKELGIDREQVIVINNAEALGKGGLAFKEALKNIPGVLNIARSTAFPGRNNNSRRYNLESKGDETLVVETNFVDYDYFETYGVKLTDGKTPDESFKSNQQLCLINESAVRVFEIKDLEKTRFLYGRTQNSVQYLKIAGVVKDFHFNSLHKQIGPYMFRLNTEDYPGEYLSVKLSPGNYSKTISAIEDKWKEFTGNKSLKYFFVDDYIESLYSKEKQNAHVALLFSVFAIFVASLGLFGLTSYTVEQRTKEIGVRKALGATIYSIYFGISREVIILVSISSFIACPVTYYIAGRWLSNFYYRISPGAVSFVAGLTIALGIAILTISYRILKAANVNPARSLKYE